MKTVEIEVWVCIDADGDYRASHDVDEARAAYEADVQPLLNSAGFRMVKITLQVPTVPVTEMKGEVPALGEPVALKAV